jgi:aspartyl-tRNA(Asn)/glutamyl-tRNA(Gln) amidotransferase subunit A
MGRTSSDFLTAHALRDAYQKGSREPREVVDSCLRRQDEAEPRVKAILRLDREAVDRQLESLKNIPKEAPLWGIPVAIKDNICEEGKEARCASKILEGFRAPYSATVVSRLKKAGAILCGRTNLDEFAFGSSTENSAYGSTHNPWDLDRVPGGSSGGSAACVAAGEVPVALGSDTGGSIRQPASFCGVVGLKPTYGRVSRYGLIAFASSLDQIGPLARDVEDAALVLGVIAGWDERDSTSAKVEVPNYQEALTGDVKGLRVGIPDEYFKKGIDSQVRKSIEEAIETFRSLGAECTPVSMPHTEHAISVYYVIATAEASSNLARFDGVQYGFRAKEDRLIDMYCQSRNQGLGMESKRRILLGTYVLSSGYYDAYYLKALKVRTLIKQDFDRAFEHFDCLVTPTSPTPAFKLGERQKDPLQMYLSDIYTISANLAGVPALSLPSRPTQAGLPVGLQILAKPFDESTLFRAAHAYEQEAGHYQEQPSL